MSDLYLLPADLHNEDDDGHGWAIVEPTPSSRPASTRVRSCAPAQGSATARVRVLRTELFETTGGRTVVLVTFQPNGTGPR